MPRILFTEGRLRAFEYMMTQVPSGAKDEDTGKKKIGKDDDNEQKSNNGMDTKRSRATSD